MFGQSFTLRTMGQSFLMSSALDDSPRRPLFESSLRSDFDRPQTPRPTRMYMMLPATIGTHTGTDTHHWTFFAGDGCVPRRLLMPR